MATSPPSAEGRSDLLPGTLDLLILRTLVHGPRHGYGIVQHLKLLSNEVVQVEEGSLYPALQRLRLQRLVTAEWRRTPTGRRARYYDLTSAGRARLATERQAFERMVTAIQLVLQHAP